MKSDKELKSDIESELEWEPSINSANIGVAVKAGVVTLTGHLDHYAQRSAVERAVRRVAGVAAIASDMEVRLAPEHVRDDTDIATTASTALRWQALIPPDKVHVKVERGWVTLTGEVEWNYQRKAAEDTVRPLVGVVGVSNEITLKARVTPADVATRIGNALARHAQGQARDIRVSVAGSTVTLRGKVDSLAEQGLVQAAAWAAPGVSTVVSELHVNR